MKLHSGMTMGNHYYCKGDDIPWYKVYPFFLIHMLGFGGSGFFMAYGDKRPDILFLYMHGGFAILIYTVFYFAMFGRDEVKWMFINAALGITGIIAQIGWILSLFGKSLGDYPIRVHVIPFLYFVLYTFLLRQAVLDMTRSREAGKRKQYVEYGYIATMLLVSAICYYLKD